MEKLAGPGYGIYKRVSLEDRTKELFYHYSLGPNSGHSDHQTALNLEWCGWEGEREGGGREEGGGRGR